MHKNEEVWSREAGSNSAAGKHVETREDTRSISAEADVGPRKREHAIQVKIGRTFKVEPVERKGVEPSTSALRTQRSPN
jgi:hypothetical protein